MTYFIQVSDDGNSLIFPERETFLPDAASVHDDDRFPGLAELLEDFLTPQLELATDPLQPDQLLGLFVERLALDMPLEMQTLREGEGEANGSKKTPRLSLGTSPPTQWIETSVQPVLHRLRVTLELEPEQANDDPRNQSLES
jgi:hypothetical protein